MRNAILQLLAVALLLPMSAAGQSLLLCGLVRDAGTQEPIPSANVMLCSLPDTAAQSFAMTDYEGRFAIVPATGGSWLVKVTYVGYRPQIVKVEIADTTTIHIAMKADDVMLRQIVVKGRKPGIKVRGDTIDYDFSKYVNGSEQVLGDMLRKLPGIEVDDKGQVTANGKQVDKILVNGQDFFGNHNEQVTNNLPAGYVDKIQLRRNYSEFSLLKGFDTRKGTALNVDIDSLHRGRVTGNGELWGGYRDKWRTGLNLYSFGSKVMWGVGAKYFNTGEEMMTLLDYIKLLGGVNNYASRFGGDEGVIDNGMPASSFVDNSTDTYRRTNAVVTGNVAWNPNENIKINAFYIYNGENSRSLYDMTRFFPGSGVVESLSQESRRTKDFHHVGLDFKWAMPHHAAIAYMASFTAMPQKADNRTTDAGGQVWATNTDSWAMMHTVSWMKNWNNKQLLTLSARYQMNDNRKNISIGSDTLLIPEIGTVGRFAQQQHVKSVQAGMDVSFIHKMAKSWQIRATGDFGVMTTAVGADAGETPFTSARQTDICRLYDAGIALQKSRGLFTFTAGIHTAFIDAYSSGYGFVVLPNLSVEWDFSAIHSLSLSYDNSFERDNDALPASCRMVEDYNHTMVYEGVRETLHKRHDLKLIYHYFDIISDLSLVFTAGSIITRHPYVSNYATRGSAVYVNFPVSDKDSRVEYANINLKKGLGIPLMLSLKSTYTRSTYQVGYDGVMSHNSYGKLSGNASLTSKFKTLLNGEVGCKYELADSKAGLSGFKTHLRSYEIYVKPFAVRESSFNISLPLSYIRDHSMGRSLEYFDMGIQALYKCGKLSLSLEGRNLLHTGSFSRMSFDTRNEYVESSSEHRMPGFLIAGVKMNF